MNCDLIRSVERMADRIAAVLDRNVHSVWLYGSVVLDDFQLGWSDIDLLVLTCGQISEQQAQQLVGLRQAMADAEPDNLYYRSFEGIIADRDEYLSGSFSRLVYWGTSGQRITGRYRQDAFSAYELVKYGQSVYGENDRSIFPLPSGRELRAAVKQHYESIRRYAVQTDEKLYSCGWLLDIARCVYTLRNHDIIAKTQAGFWALSEHVFPDEEPLKKALQIRQDPLVYKDREDVKQWLKTLGPAVQQYADILQRELTGNLLIRKMTDRDLEPLYRLLSDPGVMRFLEPPFNRERTVSFLRKALSETPPVYAVTADSTFIGYVIYHPYEEDSIEIGWVLLPEYWGKGYASALTEQMIDQAACAGKTPVIECDPRQEITGHIARKFGFSRTESRDGLDVYRLL